MKTSLLLAAALVLAVAPALSGCAATTHPDVMATFYPLQYFTQRIAGPNLLVGSVVKPGTEPHDYEPTAKDLDKIVHAKALVIEGAGFEGWLRTAQQQAPDTRLIVASDGIALNENPDSAEASTLPHDPHTWMDPMLAVQMVATIEAGLNATYPGEVDAMRDNANALRHELLALDAEYRAGLAHCAAPFAITSHSAFGYMAARYGFTQIGVSGLDPESEPSPQDVRNAVDVAKAHNITVIFFEDNLSPAVAQAIAREAGSETTTRVLSPIEFAPEGKDYFDLMHADLAALRDGMKCA
jgi:zinc transport system substrate-binding protein